MLSSRQRQPGQRWIAQDEVGIEVASQLYCDTCVSSCQAISTQSLNEGRVADNSLRIPGCDMDSYFYCDQATRAVHLNPIEKYYLQLLGRPFIIAGDMSRTLLYCGLSFAVFAAARFLVFQMTPLASLSTYSK